MIEINEVKVNIEGTKPLILAELTVGVQAMATMLDMTTTELLADIAQALQFGNLMQAGMEKEEALDIVRGEKDAN